MDQLFNILRTHLNFSQYFFFFHMSFPDIQCRSCFPFDEEFWRIPHLCFLCRYLVTECESHGNAIDIQEMYLIVLKRFMMVCILTYIPAFYVSRPCQ